MVEYGVAVTNKFHFLSDEEGANPDEILSKASQIKKEKGPIVKKPAAPPVQTDVVKPERTFANKENEGTRGAANTRGNRRGRGAPRGFNKDSTRERGFNKDSNRERRPRNQEGDAPVTEGREERVEGDRPYRGRGRGGFRRGGTRGDRVSGSDAAGVRGRDKRNGHGKGNWGTAQDELKGETEPLNEVEGEKVTENVAPDAVVEPEQEKEEEKPAGITLAEWKKRQEQNNAQNFNVRKPNIDKKLVPVKRDEDEDKHEEEYVYTQRESRHKKVDIPVNFNAGNTRSYRGDRENRRGGRGGRGFNKDSKRGQAFVVTQDAFPAL